MKDGRGNWPAPRCDARPAQVLVVGAGPGGLAAAMLLRAAGAEVTVVEKEATPGGRTGVLRRDGFTFDIGPTFFLYPEILREIFAACGHDLDAEVDLIRLDPMYRLQFADGRRIDATADRERLIEQVAGIDARDAANVPAYLEENSRKFEVFRPILQRPFLSAGRSARGRHAARPAPAAALEDGRPELRAGSAIRTSGSPSRSSRSTSACRRSSARRSTRSSPISSTASASFTRAAAATRSPLRWHAWRPTWASISASPSPWSG